MNVAVNEYTKLKQQLEKNTIIIKMLEHLKEVICKLILANTCLYVFVFDLCCV